MLSWVLSQKQHDVQTGTGAGGRSIPGIVAISAATLTGGVVLQALISYGTAMGYMYYKRTHIAVTFAELLKIADQVSPTSADLSKLNDLIAGSRVWFYSPSTQRSFGLFNRPVSSDT
jgi:hypothetical protein